MVVYCSRYVQLLPGNWCLTRPCQENRAQRPRSFTSAMPATRQLETYQNVQFLISKCNCYTNYTRQHEIWHWQEDSASEDHDWIANWMPALLQLAVLHVIQTPLTWLFHLCQLKCNYLFFVTVNVNLTDFTATAWPTRHEAKS